MNSTSAHRSPLRIVSLLPAATEIVCALGFSAELVGVSHECDFPPAVRGLPVLTTSKLVERPSSRAVDQDVREIVRQALSIYDIDVAALQRAAPDVIVTQDLCEVCAIPLGEVQRAVREILPQVRLVNLHPERLGDLWSNLREVATALGDAARAEPLIAGLQARLNEISRRATAQKRRPHVLTIEWLDPLMIGGLWMPELVDIVGGHALLTQAGERAPTVTREALHKLSPEPDVVLFKPCGYRLERSLMELEAMRELVGDLKWPALTAGDVFLADGNAFFNRPGPRLVESAEILAAVVHPFEFRDFERAHADSFMRVARR